MSENAGDVRNVPVRDLPDNLSVRARKCMNRLGVVTLGDLAQKTAHELLGAKNFGETTLREVRDLLGRHGLSLKCDGASPPLPWLPRLEAVEAAVARLQACQSREAELERCVRDLLCAVDSSWEEKGLGHDWPDAVAAARALLRERKEARKP